jgi:hypothetical protein
MPNNIVGGIPDSRGRMKKSLKINVKKLGYIVYIVLLCSR